MSSPDPTTPTTEQLALHSPEADDQLAPARYRIGEADEKGAAARDYAVLSLDEKQLPGYPRQSFKKRSPVDPRDPRDLALGRQIISGVTKNLFHLEHVLGTFARRPLTQVDPKVRLILLVALYQLRFLDRVPDHAATVEAVRQTRRLGVPRASGFVNAVLRTALREPEVDLPRRSDSAAYAELVLSHSRELFEKLAEVVGTDRALQICEHDNRTPPILVRLNAGHEPRELSGDGIDARPHEKAGLFVVEGAKQADFARWAEAGVGQVQDATAAGVIDWLDVQPGMTVLDRCCGVGTKTQQLVAAVGESGTVIATDTHGKRIHALRKLAKARNLEGRLFAFRAGSIEELAAQENAPTTQFDRILIDAPCSNSGVMARRPEARFHQTPDALASLAELQQFILNDTADAVGPGGLLAYSTCSIWPEENETIVRRFLETRDDFELVQEQSTLPSLDAEPAKYHDGGYVATLRRK